MSRSAKYTEALRIDRELSAARTRVRDAQARARLTGVRMPREEYTAMWETIRELERALDGARRQLIIAEEAAAERFVGIVRAEHPAVFAQIASRAGVEA